MGYFFVVVRGLLSSCGVWAAGSVGSVVGGTWALLLKCASSVVVSRGLSSSPACGILVPQPGIEPMSPALEGGFFTTGPLGKSLHWLHSDGNNSSSHRLLNTYYVPGIC